MYYTISTLDQLKPVLIGYRKKQGLSQKDMAIKLGIKQQSYQYLESNPQKITVERLFKVLTLLGVKLHFSDSELNIDTAHASRPVSSNSHSTSINSDNANSKNTNSVKNSHKEVW